MKVVGLSCKGINIEYMLKDLGGKPTNILPNFFESRTELNFIHLNSLADKEE